MQNKHFLLIDNQYVVRLGLKTILKNNFSGCEIHETEDAAAVLNLIQANNYDIIFLEINIPNLDSQQLVKDILAKDPNSNILIFSSGKEQIYTRTYLSNGAKGFIEKTADNEELAYAIQSILRGHIYLSETMKANIINNRAQNITQNPFNALSKKEMEVLKHIAQGFGVNDTAKIMNLSSSTIATHKARILTKLRVKSIFELIDLTRMYNTAS